MKHIELLLVLVVAGFFGLKFSGWRPNSANSKALQQVEAVNPDASTSAPSPAPVNKEVAKSGNATSAEAPTLKKLKELGASAELLRKYKKEIELCDVEPGLNSSCLVTTAVESLDPVFCMVLPVGRGRIICLETLAERKSDWRICDLIGSKFNRENCLTQTSLKAGDVLGCKRILDTEFAKKTCLKDNPDRADLCDYVDGSQISYKRCMIYAQRDFSACPSADHTGNKLPELVQECRLRIALQLKDGNLCKEIQDYKRLNECNSKLTQQPQFKLPCGITPGERSAEVLSRCYQSLNDQAGRRRLLDGILEDCGDRACVSETALKLKNPEVCMESQRFTDGGDFCLAYLRVKGVAELPVCNDVKRSDFKKYCQTLTWVPDASTSLDQGLVAEMFSSLQLKQTDEVNRMLNAGYPVNAASASSKLPTLHFAFHVEAVALGKLLLEKGADPTAQDAYGRDALHYLIERSCNSNRKMNGITDSLLKETIQLMVQKGYNVKDPISTRYLRWAAQKDFHSCNPVVEALVSAGADINAQDEWKRTALDYAREKQNDELVKFLLAHGAEPGKR